jgi:hypothetical protein
MKMIAIGLGKQRGAEFFHRQGFPEFHHLIPAVGSFTLTRVNIPFGLALIENGYGRLSQVEAVPNARILAREQELLRIARERMARLPQVEAVDVLVVDRIGKDISGSGADPNVVNRDCTGTIAASELYLKPRVQRMIVRDLTEATEGNATGIGMADVALRQAVEKVDPIPTYMNNITAKSPLGAALPMAVESDRRALHIALACCTQVDVETARLMRIRDTKHLEELWVSEALLPELVALGSAEPLTEPAPIAFDANGMFVE